MKSRASKVLGYIYFSMDQKSLHSVEILDSIEGLAKYRYDVHTIQTIHNAFFYVEVDLKEISHLCFIHESEESKKAIKELYETFDCCICGINHIHAAKSLEYSDNYHFLGNCRNYDEMMHGKGLISCSNKLCTYLHESVKFMKDIECGKYESISEVDARYRISKDNKISNKTTEKTVIPIATTSGRTVGNNKWTDVVKNDIKDADNETPKPIENPKPVITQIPVKPIKTIKPAETIKPIQVEEIIKPATIDTKPVDIKNEPIVISGKPDTDKAIIDFCKRYNINTRDDNLVYTIYSRCKLFKSIFESITSANVNKMEFNMMLSFLGFDTKNENTGFIKALVLKDEKNKVIKEINDMIAIIDSIEN